MASVAQSEGPHFIEVCVQRGTRSDLGRPKTTTHDAKAAFMGHIDSPYEEAMAA